jgi:cytosine/adenosine deaminase-related metal-dependent hydrolase
VRDFLRIQLRAVMAFSLQARVVYPVDRPPIEHGLVTIEDDRIVAVGDNRPGGHIIDLGDVALLPGFVNAHTHLEFSYLQQPLGQPGMPLIDWLRLVIAERGRRSDPTLESIAGGVLESHASGVMTIGDIATSNETYAADITQFHEVIGFSRARADSAFQALQNRFLDLAAAGITVRQGVSPHAPYTVSPALLRKLIKFANDHHFPVSMHLAESHEELELLRNGTGQLKALLEERSMWDGDAIPPGMRPIDYLRMLSEAPCTLVVHGNYLENDELAFLGAERRKMTLVFCPRTHAYFFHPPYPLGAALAAGVRVALGTDSRASNPDLSLLSEMRHVARMHQEVDPNTLLFMGTLAGAEALGRDQFVGAIAPSMTANLVAVPIPANSKGSPNDILAALFADDAGPSAIYLAGRRL